jgi:hypothetical protein
MVDSFIQDFKIRLMTGVPKQVRTAARRAVVQRDAGA